MGLFLGDHGGPNDVYYGVNWQAAPVLDLFIMLLLLLLLWRIGHSPYIFYSRQDGILGNKFNWIVMHSSSPSAQHKLC